MRKLLLIILLIIPGSILAPLCANTFFVSKSGLDSNDGLTKETAFLTISKAAGVARAGDTVYIMSGTYEETLSPAYSGYSGQPIVFTSYPGHKVIISAMQALSGWTHDADNVYKTYVSWDLGQRNMVFNGSTFMDLARWPNKTEEGHHAHNGIYNTGGSGGSTDQNSYLTYSPGIPDVDWENGGSLFFYCTKAGWTAWKAWIKDSDATSVTFDFNKNGSWVQTEHPPGDLGYFYLEGVRGALDYKNEWYLNTTTNTLYVQVPGGGKPEDGEIKMRRRNYTIDLNNKSYIEVRNLAVTGGEIRITGSANNNLIYGVTSMYGNHTRGIQSSAFSNNQSILMEGSYNTVERCEVGYGTANGIYVKGSYNKVINSHVHHFNSLGCYDAVLNMRSGSNTRIYNNTLSHGGRDVVQAFNNWSDFAYNDVSRSNLIANDCGLIYTVNGPRNIKIHHNWFHDAYAITGQHKAAGIYLDNDASSFRVYNNVVWNTQWTSIQINWNGRDIDIFNNTLVDGSDVMGAWHKDGTSFSDVNVWNNLSNKSGWEPQSDKQNNLTYTENPFVDRANGDFRLKENSAAVDAGREISGYTENYVGDSPDIGAYEYGKEAWVPGIDWDTRFGPAYNGCYGIPGEVCEAATGQAAYPQGMPHMIPGRIESEDYDLGPDGLAYHDSTDVNDGGEYRNDGVDVISLYDGEAGFGVGEIKRNEWQEYSIEVDSAGNYTMSVRVASERNGGSFRIELDETDISGEIVFEATGAADVWDDVEFPVYLKEGRHELRFLALDSAFRTNYMDFLLLEGEDVAIVNKNAFFRRSLSYEVEVDYEAIDDRSVAVALWKGNELLGEGAADVVTGEGRDTLEIILSEFPAAGTDYKLAAYLLERGSVFEDALSVEVIEGVTFLDESVELVNVQDTMGLYTSYNFKLEHKIAANSIVLLEFWKGETLISENSIEITGDGSTGVNIELDDLPEPGDDYLLKAFLLDNLSMEILDSSVVENLCLLAEEIEILSAPKYILNNDVVSVELTYMVFELKYLVVQVWQNGMEIFKKIAPAEPFGWNTATVDMELPNFPDGSDYQWKVNLASGLNSYEGEACEGGYFTVEKNVNISKGVYSFFHLFDAKFLAHKEVFNPKVYIEDVAVGWEIAPLSGNVYTIGAVDENDSILFLSFDESEAEISLSDSLGVFEKWGIVKGDTVYKLLPLCNTGLSLGLNTMDGIPVLEDVAEGEGFTWVVEAFIPGTSVSGQFNIGNVRTYPNPAKDVLYVEFQEDGGESHISIFNLNGMAELSHVFKGGQHQINIVSLLRGSYVLEIKNEAGVYRKLLIVE